ncbi:SpoIIE family protein phosphatase [Micromonospora sp. KC213]|uniref:SpoIIE family protein phosphatase n=1 Tax=Micromonospora sp. KC213 TaxID=2530378 RepID=UPI001050CA50|nr:SpoIIE family protein phosphatase [Micromonospora sp. KC213]TDC40133.1 transcriptional regulator [Micromonospora sp. KC213]
MSAEAVPAAGVWYRVESGSAASAVRRTAERLGVQVGLAPNRVAELAIVTAELTSNLVKHAREGTVLLRPVRAEGEAGVELVAVDSGPGMADLAFSARDGQSTTGTLGIGLGAIDRQATWYDAWSWRGKGTVSVVQVWSAGVPAPPMWAAGLTRPITGEQVSGDGHAVRVVEGRQQVLVCDGLGHGRLAGAAAEAALVAFRTAPVASPAVVLRHLHQSMTHTRGAAVAVAELDPSAVLLRYAGVGNIAGVVLGPDGGRKHLVSLPGIAGHQRPVIREYDYPFPPEATLVMHSDGVVGRWRIEDYPGLIAHSPLVVAATLLRDAGVRRDDACVLVARSPE